MITGPVQSIYTKREREAAPRHLIQATRLTLQQRTQHHSSLGVPKVRAKPCAHEGCISDNVTDLYRRGGEGAVAAAAEVEVATASVAVIEITIRNFN